MLKLNYNAKIFLLINGLFTVANGLSGTFVNIYLWKSKNDLGNIGLFNFFNYLFIPIAFMVGGWLTKRKSATFSLRVGILFHGFFYFLILATGHNSANYVIQLGCVLGIAAGFYWVAFHTLSFDLTSRYNWTHLTAIMVRALFQDDCSNYCRLHNYILAKHFRVQNHIWVIHRCLCCYNVYQPYV